MEGPLPIFLFCGEKVNCDARGMPILSKRNMNSIFI
jgi:hypothetical protein